MLCIALELGCTMSDKEPCMGQRLRAHSYYCMHATTCQSVTLAAAETSVVQGLPTLTEANPMVMLLWVAAHCVIVCLQSNTVTFPLQLILNPKAKSLVKSEKPLTRRLRHRRPRRVQYSNAHIRAVHAIPVGVVCVPNMLAGRTIHSRTSFRMHCETCTCRCRMVSVTRPSVCMRLMEMRCYSGNMDRKHALVLPC